MSASRYDVPSTNPKSELRELLQHAAISPEIADLRLALLRQEIPEALIQIDSVRADDTAIAIKTTIGLPGGARHSAIAAADVDTTASWADQLAMVQAIAIARALDGLGITSGRVLQSDVAPEQPPRKLPSSATQDDDHLPEYSWNAFWQTMNARNISRDQVEQTLGKSVQETTPKEAVEALKAAGLLE